MKQLRTSSCFFFGGVLAVSIVSTLDTEILTSLGASFWQTDLRSPEKGPFLKGVFQPSFLRDELWVFRGVSSNRATNRGDLQHCFCQVQLRNSVHFLKTTAVGVRCGWNHHQACNTTETSFADVFEVIVPLSSISKWSIFHQAKKNMKLIHPRNSTWTSPKWRFGSYEFPFHFGVIFRFQQFGGGNFDGQN